MSNQNAIIDRDAVEKPHLAFLVDLHNRLDSLWTAYLDHLNAYVSAQETLQTHLSAGFLSLARANFRARDGVRRYGKDFYNDRAVASRRVHVNVSEDRGRPEVELVPWLEGDVTEDDRNDGCPDSGTEDKKDGEPRQQPSPLHTPGSEPGHNSDCKEKSTGEDTNGQDEGVTNDCLPETSKMLKPSSDLDPIRWFGILVPPDLRVAQSSFVSALDEAATQAVNAARSMRELEAEIRRVRKDVKRAEKSTDA